VSDSKRTLKKSEQKEGALIFKQGELKLTIEDWRGALAFLIVVSFTILFSLTVLLTRDIQLASLVGTVYSGPTTAVVTWYFMMKSKKEVKRRGPKEA